MNPNPNIENLKPFDKYPERINREGRPRQLVGEVSKQLETKGFKPAKAEQIRAIFMQFVNMPEKDLKEVMSDTSQPMINRIVVKAMLGGKGFEVIKDLIERAHGKANQSIDIKQNEGIQIHIHNASKEYDLNPDGSVTKNNNDMEINVKRRGKNWMVGFNHEGQHFTLDYRVETKEEAEWMKDRLSESFDRANADLYRLIELSTKENEATWANEGCLFGLTEKEFEEYQHLLKKYKGKWKK